MESDEDGGLAQVRETARSRQTLAAFGGLPGPWRRNVTPTPFSGWW
jgi:hypothetical protein